MTTSAADAQRSRGSVVLLLGASTFVVTVLAGVFFETDEGSGLTGRRTVAAAGLSLLLLIGTVTAFVGTAGQQPLPRSAASGLILGVSAIPATLLLAGMTLTMLNAAGIYW